MIPSKIIERLEECCNPAAEIRVIAKEEGCRRQDLLLMLAIHGRKIVPAKHAGEWATIEHVEGKEQEELIARYEEEKHYIKRETTKAGDRFGMLTVLEPDIWRGKSHHCLCRCDCGNVKEVRLSSLRNGKTKACGCMMGKRVGGKKGAAHAEADA